MRWVIGWPEGWTGAMTRTRHAAAKAVDELLKTFVNLDVARHAASSSHPTTTSHRCMPDELATKFLQHVSRYSLETKLPAICDHEHGQPTPVVAAFMHEPSAPPHGQGEGDGADRLQHEVVEQQQVRAHGPHSTHLHQTVRLPPDGS